MAKVITTRGISFHLEEMIKEAKKSITIVTPYLKMAQSLYDRLRMADIRGVEITIIYGKTGLVKSQQQQLDKLENCKVIFVENLHAKVFINEQQGIIGSMNLYEYSEINNFEMGVYFTKKEDLPIWDSTIYEIDLIANSGILEKESKSDENVIKEKEIIYSIINGKNDFYLKNYPIDNIDVSKKYGFVTYNFMRRIRNLSKMQDENADHFHKELDNDYRVYWRSPYNRICIYSKKNLLSLSDIQNTEYEYEAISKANDIIRKKLY